MVALLPRSLRRAPLTWWLCTAIVSTAAALLVFQMFSQAQASASRLGSLVSVQVATRDISPGEAISADDFATQDRPKAMLPDSKPVDPTGQVATSTIFKNEPLVEAKVSGSSLNPSVALLESDERGVAIPIGAATPNLRVGDYVDVFATHSPSATSRDDRDTPESSSAEPATTQRGSITTARVVGINEKSATLAVKAAHAATAANLAASGNAVITLTNPHR